MRRAFTSHQAHLSPQFASMAPISGTQQPLTFAAAAPLLLQYLAREDLLNHDLISCWWIALKHASVRTAVPNR